MDDMRLSREVSIWQTLRERLKAQYELEDEDPALIDTLDGATELNERLLKVAMSAKEDVAFAEAIKGMIADLQDRKKRLERRAVYKRDQVAWAMQETGQKSIVGAGLTLGQRMGEAKLVIDEKMLPEDYTKTVTTVEVVPDKDLIKDGLNSGKEIPGVSLSNPMPILTIRGK